MKKNVLKKLKKDEKAISPVVATVIIVAVAIAVAIAVAYWVTGLVPAFTRYEELKIQSTYIDTTLDACNITIRNTGSSDATITEVLLNARLELVDGSGWSIVEGTATLIPGESATIEVLGVQYPAGAYQAGVIYDFQVHTSGGGSYPSSARAP
jgi:flagellin-like protein